MDHMEYLLGLLEGISPDPLILHQDHKTRLHPLHFHPYYRLPKKLSFFDSIQSTTSFQYGNCIWIRQIYRHLFDSETLDAQLVESKIRSDASMGFPISHQPIRISKHRGMGYLVPS